MKCKILMLLVLLSVCVGNTTAQRQIRYAEALAVARNMLNYLDYDNNSISAIAQVRVRVFNESDTKTDTLLYEVELANGAEILLSGNRACKPVLAHGYSGSIIQTEDELPGGVQFFVDSYLEQIEHAFTYTDTLPYVAEWEELKVFDDKQIGVKGAVVVAPLLTSKWGQDESNCGGDHEAYNHYVNHFYNGTRCKVGCVAVAMGQIMNYWKYPVWTPVLDRQFDWCNMADSLCNVNNDNYIAQREAVSWLLFKCGKSVDMEYCSNGTSSSASIRDARDALVTKFGYSNDAEYQSKWLYSIDAWTGRIRNNLNNGWPVLYRGRRPFSTKSHAFVCDGYNNSGEFHFNFGWRGDKDEYFALDALTPTEHNYNNSQGAVFYIHPAQTQDYCDYTMNLEQHYSYYYLLHDIPFTPSFFLQPAYRITPKTFTTLVSCPETSDSTWRIIPDTADAEYVAHKEIILQSGFKVKRGAEFRAFITPCPNCENAQAPQLRNVLTTDTSLGENQKNTLQKVPVDNGMTLYPNPATQILTLAGLDSVKTIHIFDYRGVEVKCWKVVGKTGNEIKINVVQLPTGTYIIRADKRQGKSFVGKFVKQ